MHKGNAGAKNQSTFKKEGMCLEPYHVLALLDAMPELKKVSQKETAKSVICECGNESVTSTGEGIVSEKI